MKIQIDIPNPEPNGPGHLRIVWTFCDEGLFWKAHQEFTGGDRLPGLHRIPEYDATTVEGVTAFVLHSFDTYADVLTHNH